MFKFLENLNKISRIIILVLLIIIAVLVLWLLKKNYVPPPTEVPPIRAPSARDKIDQKTKPISQERLTQVSLPLEIKIFPSSTILTNSRTQIRPILKGLSITATVDFIFEWGDNSSVLVQRAEFSREGFTVLVEHSWPRTGVYNFKVKALTSTNKTFEKITKIYVTQFEILSNPASAKAGSPYSLSFQIKNLPPASKVSYLINWGDGKSNNFFENSTDGSGVNKISASHVYGLFGNYQPSLVISSSILGTENISLPGVIVTTY